VVKRETLARDGGCCTNWSAQQCRPYVRVIGDGHPAALVLSLDEVHDAVLARCERRRQRARVQAPSLYRKRRQLPDVPLDAEVIRGDPRRERGDRQARRHTLIVPAIDLYGARLQVPADHLSERIVPEAGLERHGDAQPAQAERDVRRAAARMRRQRPPSALPDQVDERLPDDDEHPLDLLDEIEVPRAPAEECRGGDPARGS
jgi:hypothetical protein